MKVFLVQMNPTLGNVEKNLEKMVKTIKEQIENKTDIVVFPELSLTGYLLEEMTFDVSISEIPKELLELSKEISIIFGAVELGKDQYHYNSAFYLEDGELKHTHRKVYLPTYGLYDEGRYFKAGESIKAFDTKFGRVGMLVCEDMFHQTSSFLLAQDGAHYIFAIVNSPAKVSGSIGEAWEAICRASAVSNNVHMVMVNRVGIEDGVAFFGKSFIISATGELVTQLPIFEECGVIAELDIKDVAKSRFTSGSSKDEKLDLVVRELNRIMLKK